MKMYAIVINEALEKMGDNRGKIAAQCGHAFVGCVMKARNSDPGRWKEYSKSNLQTKIVLHASRKSIDKIIKELNKDVPTVLITDRGLTVFDGVPTETVLGVGPIRNEEIINKIKGLPLLT